MKRGWRAPNRFRWQRRLPASMDGSASTPSSCPKAAIGRCCASCRSSSMPRASRTESSILLIDALDTTVDVTPLAELMADPAIEIVLHAGRQDVAILRRVWNTELHEHLRHPDRGRVRRRQRPGRLREPDRRDPRPPGRQDRELHAVGCTSAHRRAAQLRPRGCPAPARAHRRAPAPAERDRPARVGARGMPPARVRDRRTRSGDRLGAPAAHRPA